MAHILSILLTLKAWIWSAPLLILLIGTGIYFTWILRGLQFRYLGFAFKEIFKHSQDDSSGDISHFQALMTTLAGAIGTGSVVGVTTALMVGGIGALFWMWVTTLLGMATKYAESLLAVKFRVTDELEEMVGGPMEYIERGLGWRWVAVIFAICGSIAALTTGNMVQINAIVDAAANIYSGSSLWIGIITAAFTGVILVGGVKSIGRIAGVTVPFMALFYFFGGLYIIFSHWEYLPQALSMMFTSALSPEAPIGALAGTGIMLALREGVARGVFTTEAGLGISSIAAAAAKTDSAVRQALINMTGAFFTMIVCTITGLVVAVTVLAGEANGAVMPREGATAAIDAFRVTFAGGGHLVAAGLILFAYTTLIAWAYYGEKCFEYLFGANFNNLYRMIFTLLIIPGAITDIKIAWGLADVVNGLMIVPNLIAVLALSPLIVRETKRFFDDPSNFNAK